MFLISFNDNGRALAARSITLPLCVASDEPADDLIADFKRRRKNDLAIRVRTLGFVSALIVVGIVSFHLASRYFADSVWRRLASSRSVPCWSIV